MKFLLLKTLLLRKQKDQGFTLPLVIAIGMVMVLLSAVNLVQSGEENLNAISQRGSADALAAAELGVARYRDLLLNNRVLAVNDLGNWTGFDNQTCSSITNTAGGWADTSETTGWRNITVGGETIGSYRLINYQYDRNGDNLFSQLSDDNDPDNNPATPTIVYDPVTNNHNDTNNDGTSDAFGTLIVQGRDTTGSIAQLQVTIPLGVNTQDLEDLDPAIWVQQSNLANLGTVNINGDPLDPDDNANIVLYRPSGSGGCDDPTDYVVSGETQRTISDSRNLPPLITPPNPSGLTKTNDLYSPISDSQNGSRYNFGTIVLGRFSDIQNTSEGSHVGDDRYYFEVGGNLELNDGERIESDGEARVILYVDGNLTINGNVDITNSSNSATSKYLEIHVTGDVIIQGTGDVEIKGLIHAPNGTVRLRGSGNVDITGSVFANNWDNTRTGTVSITTDEYEFYSVTPNRTPAPLTFRPSEWETQQAN